MMKIAICDDEKNIRAYLSALIKKQGMDCDITEYATAGDYLAGGVEYDILFLDIELECPGQDMDGMEMARQIRSMEDTKQPIIIFVTGYEKYVYDAFDVVLSVKLNAPAPCRLVAPDLDFICRTSADCLSQHLQVI